MKGSSVAVFRCLLITASFAFGIGAADAQQKTVAITFDDLPYVIDADHDSSAPMPDDDVVALNQRILAALRRNDTPAIGFVIERTVQSLARDVARRLLAAWTEGDFSLGNHTYSHADTNGLALVAIADEIDKGAATIAPLMASAGKRLRFVRFPMNHTGETPQRRDAITALLRARGYDLAASTIDTSDYVFDRAYGRALALGRADEARRIKDAYLAHTAFQIDYYADLNRRVLGYAPPQIMLLHLNRLNGDSVPDILSLFGRKGYRFVTLEAAQSDPAYRPLSGFATPFGPMWGYRWARERGVAVDGRLEQEPPSWVVRYPVAVD
ncbi:MAG TPA: polysaccharide deacetylase family protein [Vineibacter sp.]|nr:polysaccharide deacetylase family protein [Vineibacter sp.]